MTTITTIATSRHRRRTTVTIVGRFLFAILEKAGEGVDVAWREGPGLKPLEIYWLDSWG
jgi:hypothetical protein